MLISKLKLTPEYSQFVVAGGDQTDNPDWHSSNKNYAIENQTLLIGTAPDHLIDFVIDVDVYKNSPEEEIKNNWILVYSNFWQFNNKIFVQELFDDDSNPISIDFNNAKISIYKNKELANKFKIYLEST